MPDGTVRLEREGPLVRIFFQNRARKNALTPAMMAEATAAVRSCDTDPSIGAVLFRGAGGTFCSGMDLGDSEAQNIGTPPEEAAIDLERAVLDSGHATIALVEGHAIGAGFQLASACDFRFAVKGSRGGVPPARLGLVYPPSSLRRLGSLVGDTEARRLLFLGEQIDTLWMERTHWATVVPHAAQAAEEALRLSSELSTRSALSIRATKQILRALELGHETEQLFTTLSRQARLSGEAAEGVAAFRRKRQPDFPSRRRETPSTYDGTVAIANH